VAPGVEQLHTHRFKIDGVARYDRHGVRQGGRGNERIAIGARVRHMEPCTVLRHRGVNSQYAVGERRQSLIVQPGSEH